MSNGIVVDHKESGVRYAVSEKNFNPKVHERVRDLLPGETVHGFRPKRRGEAVEPATEQPQNVEGGDTAPATSEERPTGRARGKK